MKVDLTIMIQENFSLQSYNTFGIDARCRWFAEYDTPEELKQLIDNRPTEKILHIGGGSNLLFLNDFDGMVLHRAKPTSVEDGVEVLDGGKIRVSAGIVWDELVEYSLEQGWFGLENLSLIPGEVGASAVQNIGAYGAEAKDYIVEVECMNLHNGKLRTFSNEACKYGYRQSIFKTPEYRGQWAVLFVTYRLSDTFIPLLDYGGIRAELERRNMDVKNLTAQQLRQVIIDIRRSKLPDPKVQGNAGSFFMNPVVPREKYEALAKDYPSMPHYEVDANHVKIPAGWMIEQCGWKGRALGKAAVHDRQALVLVNLGGATGQEILDLCHTVCASVKEKFGIEISPEVNFIL